MPTCFAPPLHCYDVAAVCEANPATVRYARAIVDTLQKQEVLTADARRHLCVVLVGARNPQNIGAAARAMQDFGFNDLRVVNPFAPPFEAAQIAASSAVGAGEVMRSARLFSQLGEAIADCVQVVGTTAIGDRNLQQAVFRLQEAAPLLRTDLQALAAQDRPAAMAEVAGASVEVSARDTRPCVALLFGSEKTGLTREQLSFCSFALTVPLWAPEGRHLSMNLGQAVAVCLYELSREGFEGARALPERSLVGASVADRERLLSLLLETMQLSEYTRRFPANARPEVVRQLVERLATTSEEAATWMGLLKMVLRTLRERVAGCSCEGQGK